MRPAALVLLPLLALAASLGCAVPPLWGAPHLAACPGPLVPSEEIPDGDFLLRERVRVVGGEVDAGLELVVERRGPRLVVVGFNAFGAKAFSVVQRGSDVETESYLPALPVPPGNALRDLHAARFLPQDAAARRRERVEVARPGCGYTATFVGVERRALP
jgi:hypothetical protein